jgi:hypothetical protein
MWGKRRRLLISIADSMFVRSIFFHAFVARILLSLLGDSIE